MSPKSTDPFAKSEPAPTVSAPALSVAPPVAPPAPQAVPAQPLVVMTELDSIIHEIVQAQPAEVTTDISPVETPGLHRLSLPEYFEPHSYDCTRGDSCVAHKKTPKGQVLNHGRYVMRWLLKDKRNLDIALHVRGWQLATRRMFPDAPQALFSVNGGVETGDAILAVMSPERALLMRASPGQRSHERLRATITPTDDPKKVLMTGHPDSPHVYQPALTTSESEETGPRPGEIQVD